MTYKYCLWLLIGVTMFLSFINPDKPVVAAEKSLSWSVFMEPDYGASLYYPTELFGEGKSVKGSYVFNAKNGNAKLVLRTFLDPMRTGAEETVAKLKNGRGAHRIIDIKTGAMWFEMVGQDGPDGIVFMKTVYSCREQVVSQFNLIYPKTEKQIYESILPKMKKRFQAGIGTKTPVRECS